MNFQTYSVVTPWYVILVLLHGDQGILYKAACVPCYFDYKNSLKFSIKHECISVYHNSRYSRKSNKPYESNEFYKQMHRIHKWTEFTRLLTTPAFVQTSAILIVIIHLYRDLA